ncbi:type II secretion system protein [Pseudoalteromonas sp. MMG010]|uniref:PulJ/GspJ family protein n=1 Tax=Pseudoalteromonas sp. MMG010 TaxID=2822685 RepID=UPI0032B36C6A
MLINKRQRAFTLIELLLVVVILGILAVSSFAFINTGFSIYSQSVERQEAVAQSRFLITRLSKEIRHATPNSLRLSCDNNLNGNCNVQQCLEFTPFISATHYTNYLPSSAPFIVTAVDFELNQLTKPEIGDWATIYPLNSGDIYNENNNKRLRLSNFIDSTTSAIDQWQFEQSFAQESPSKRLYLLDQPVSFCVEGSQLYRYTNYGFHVNQLNAATLQTQTGIKRDLLAIFIANNLRNNLFFRIGELSLKRNSVLNVFAKFSFNDSESITFNHEVHVPNVP